MGRRRKTKLFWVTVGYHPGFTRDLTYWTTRIERNGELRQEVHAWPSATTVPHQTMLGEEDVAEIARLVEAVDFAALADPRWRRAAGLDTSMVRVDVVEGFRVRRFEVPLLWWEWAREVGRHECLPALDFAPALNLWHTVDRLSPRHFGRRASAVLDWRLNVQPAAAELKRLRAGGLGLDSALDHMRGRWFTLPAVREAVIEVEGMGAEGVSALLEARTDLNEF